MAWLLDQPGGWQAYDRVRTAEMALTSDLTMIECDRALLRHVSLGRLDGERVRTLRGELAAVTSSWQLLTIAPEIVARAREPFPDDRIRSLDAIHLASALVARSRFRDMAMVTLDDRIRGNATALGFEVLPV